MITKIKEKINRWHGGILVFIFIIAATLRIVGIGWGMPHSNLHPDEGLIFSPAYQCALERTFDVREYYRPNHVTIKLNTLLYVGIQELYFAPQGKSDFALNYSEHFTLFTVASRMLIALFSMGTVLLAYLITRFWGREQALLAALLFAVFPSFIEHSHYITPDIPLLFFLMCVLWAALCYLKKPSVKWIFWMSLFTALAGCEKYPGVYGCAIIAVVVIVTHIKKPLMILREGALAILFLVLGILAVSPILLIDYRTVLEVMAGQNKAHHVGADGLNFGQTLWFYTKTTAVHLGFILTLSSIYGIVRAFMKNTKMMLVMFALPVYIIPISTLSLHWERYTLPIYASGLMFGALGVFYAVDDLKEMLKKNTAVSLAVYFLLFLLPAGSLAAGAMAVSRGFLAPDSRILLQDVLAKMDITASNTVFDCNTPLDPGGFYGVFCNFEAGDPEQFKYGPMPRYIMTSSAQRDTYLEADPELYGWIADFYRALDEDHPMIFQYPVEIPSCHFLELQNIWYSARSFYRYMRGAAVGYEIRVYQMVP